MSKPPQTTPDTFNMSSESDHPDYETVHSELIDTLKEPPKSEDADKIFKSGHNLKVLKDIADSSTPLSLDGLEVLVKHYIKLPLLFIRWPQVARLFNNPDTFTDTFEDFNKFSFVCFPIKSGPRKPRSSVPGQSVPSHISLGFFNLRSLKAFVFDPLHTPSPLVQDIAEVVRKLVSSNPGYSSLNLQPLKPISPPRGFTQTDTVSCAAHCALAIRKVVQGGPYHTSQDVRARRLLMAIELATGEVIPFMTQAERKPLQDTSDSPNPGTEHHRQKEPPSQKKQTKKTAVDVDISQDNNNLKMEPSTSRDSINDMTMQELRDNLRKAQAKIKEQDLEIRNFNLRRDVERECQDSLQMSRKSALSLVGKLDTL